MLNDFQPHFASQIIPLLIYFYAMMLKINDSYDVVSKHDYVIVLKLPD